MKSYIRAVLGREKAFTLVELLIVIAIIAILTVAFLPGALKAPAKARDAGRIKTVRDIQAAVEAYIAENNGVIPLQLAATGCFNTGVAPVGSFGATPPTDQRPPTGACAAGLYWYRTINTPATQYAIAAAVELSSSANLGMTAAVAGGAAAAPITITSSAPAVGPNATTSTIGNLTATTAGGANTAPNIPTTAPFYYVQMGPQ